MSDTKTQTAARLTEAQVRERLRFCRDSEVIRELYDFGVALTKDTLEQIKTVESKAVSFAAYGTAIATLLVSSASTWAKTGNTCSLWIASFAGLAGLGCTFHAINALLLTGLKVVSEDDWVKTELDIDSLRLFRVLLMWGVLESRIEAQHEKAKCIARSQIWLAGAVMCLVFLLFQLAVVHLFSGWNVGTLNAHQVGRWQLSWWWISRLSSWGSGLLCLLGLILLYRRSRSL